MDRLHHDDLTIRNCRAGAQGPKNAANARKLMVLTVSGGPERSRVCRRLVTRAGVSAVSERPRRRNMKRRKPIACLLSACRRKTCGTRAGPNSAAGRRGRRRSAYEAPRAAADGGTRLGGAESKRRRRPRLPAPPSRVTLLGRGPALARGLGAALADAHDRDARELEVSCERAMRPALGTQAADLLVALRLHAAREAAGQDRGLRDADAEGLRHHAQR